jgi:hypothetical protein
MQLPGLPYLWNRRPDEPLLWLGNLLNSDARGKRSSLENVATGSSGGEAILAVYTQPMN